MSLWLAILAFSLVVGSIALAAYGGRLLTQKRENQGWGAIGTALLLLVIVGAGLYADLALHAPGRPRTADGLDRGEVYRFLHRACYSGDDYALVERVGHRSGPPTFIKLDDPVKDPCFVVMDKDGGKVLLGISCPTD